MLASLTLAKLLTLLTGLLPGSISHAWGSLLQDLYRTYMTILHVPCKQTGTDKAAGFRYPQASSKVM